MIGLGIDPGWEKDPFRKPKHRVVVSDDGGKTFSIIGTTEEPLEMLKLHVEGQHAVGFKQADVKIVNETHDVVADFPSYHVEPQEGPPGEVRRRIRDRWLEAVMRFLLPPSLYAQKDDPDKAKLLARWFKRKKIAIEMRPDGGAVRIYRDGNVLSEWGC